MMLAILNVILRGLTQTLPIIMISMYTIIGCVLFDLHPQYIVPWTFLLKHCLYYTSCMHHMPDGIFPGISPSVRHHMTI